MGQRDAKDRVEIGWLFGDGCAFFLTFFAGNFHASRKQSSVQVVDAWVDTSGSSVRAIDGSRRYTHSDKTVQVHFLNHITLVPHVFKEVD